MFGAYDVRAVGAPQVIYVSPGNGQTGVPAGGFMYIVFDQDFNPGVDTTGTVAIDGAPPASVIGWASGNTYAVAYGVLSAGTHAVLISGFANANGPAPDYSYTFESAALGAVSPQSVTSTVPANGASGQPSGGNIVINFGVPAALRGDVTLDGRLLPLSSGSFSSGGQTYTIPYAGLADGNHSVVVNDFMSLSGQVNSYFFNFSVDSAPQVASTSPADGAAGVPSSGNIVVTFDKAVTAAGGVTLDGAALPGGVLSPDGLTYTVPYAGIAAGAHSAAVSGFGNAAGTAADYNFGFTSVDTSVGSGGLPAGIVSVSPPDGAADVPPDGEILITFSEPVYEKTSLVTLDGKPVYGKFDAGGLTYRIPYKGLSAGSHTVDTSGFQFLGTSKEIDKYSFGFTVKAGLAPNLLNTSPGNGGTVYSGNGDIALVFDGEITVTGYVSVDGLPLSGGIWDASRRVYTVSYYSLGNGLKNAVVSGFGNAWGTAAPYRFYFTVSAAGSPVYPSYPPYLPVFPRPGNSRTDGGVINGPSVPPLKKEEKKEEKPLDGSAPAGAGVDADKVKPAGAVIPAGSGNYPVKPLSGGLGVGVPPAGASGGGGGNPADGGGSQNPPDAEIPPSGGNPGGGEDFPNAGSVSADNPTVDTSPVDNPPADNPPEPPKKPGEITPETPGKPPKATKTDKIDKFGVPQTGDAGVSGYIAAVITLFGGCLTGGIYIIKRLK